MDRRHTLFPTFLASLALSSTLFTLAGYGDRRPAAPACVAQAEAPERAAPTTPPARVEERSAEEEARLRALAADLEHEDGAVRARAAAQMRRLGSEARLHLRAELEVEPNPRAAHDLALELRELGPPRVEDFAWAAYRLRTLASAPRRAEVIGWLIAAEHPEASRVLAEWSRVEPSGDLRQLIERAAPSSPRSAQVRG